jgi:hypothetical protein
MECRCANDKVPSLIAVKWITSPNRGLDCFRRHAERFICVKPLIDISIPVRISKLKGESQNPITKVQQIRCQAG